MKRIIKNKTKLTIPTNSTTLIPIIFNGLLLDNYDLLFEPNYYLNLGHASSVFAYIINTLLKNIYIKNDTNFDIVIPRKARLGIIEEFDYNKYFKVKSHYISLTIIG